MKETKAGGGETLATLEEVTETEKAQTSEVGGRVNLAS